MDTLTRYTLADLQRCRTLVRTLQAAGQTTLEQAIASLDSVITSRHAELVDLRTPRQAASSPVEVCPACGRGMVRRWPLISGQVGQDVYGCRSCQWSEVR